MGILIICEFCKKHHTIQVKESDYWKWKAGAKIQDVMPYLKASERELLISSVCDPCWNKMK